MKGKYHIIVQNKRLRYEFDIRRNLTIIRGDSATGKTTLINMLDSAFSLGEGSGIEVVCEKVCRTLRGKDWNFLLPQIHDQIIFLDEESSFVKSKEFAALARKSDNYYVIITREDLPNLPYSVDEIYGIHTSGKYHDLRRTYNEMYRIYQASEFSADRKPERIVVEDSNAGFEFFKKTGEEAGIACESANGKSNLRNVIAKAAVKNLLAIADGAAIGSEMNELYQYMMLHPEVRCYLPESFEWIILKSGLIDGRIVQQILENPEAYIESREYFSWERYFSFLLTEQSKDTYLQYNKNKLNENYLHDKEKRAILKVMNGIKFL